MFISLIASISLPNFFVENRGQFENNVLYYSYSGIYIMKDGSITIKNISIPINFYRLSDITIA